MVTLPEVWEWSRFTHRELVDMINNLRLRIEELEDDLKKAKIAYLQPMYVPPTGATFFVGGGPAGQIMNGRT